MRKPFPYVTFGYGPSNYSMGAAVTIVGAAQCQEIEAVVADSSFASVWSAVELAVHRTFHLSRRLPAWLLGTLYAITNSLLWWRTGFHFREFEPAREIAKIAPRPVLLIHGAADSIVSANDATTLYSQAGEGKELWLIPGAQHTTGHFVERTTYGARILGFFEMVLRQVPVFRQTDPLPGEIERAQLMTQNSLRELEAI